MKFYKIALCVPLCFLLFISCSTKKEEPALFELMKTTGINFSNDIHNTKDFNIFSYRNFYNGGGAAIGDINNDGLADVFFTANMGSNKLYLNKGNWQFDDITDKAGLGGSEKWSTGVVLADVNNDGWLDIYVCNAGYLNGKAPENKLYINNHNLTFTESAAAYGLTNHGGYATHAAFFDYDLDGDLDCFIINNSFIPVNTLNYANKRDLRAADWPVADFLKGGGDKLLRNDNGKFTDVSKEAGIYGSLISFGLGVTVGDVNGDGYPDVYVSNDFFERDYLYINQKNGTFKDELEQWVQHTSLASMGADMGDINNDGYPDIFVTDMLPDDEYRLKTTTSFENIDVYRLKEKSGFYEQFQQNTLQLNNKNGKFSEIGFYSGVAASDWSWGGLMFDADNDGNNDIYVCNGINRDLTDQDFIDFFANNVVQRMVMTGEKEDVDDIISKMPSHPLVNKAFRNNGNLKFTDAAKQWGFTEPSFSNGAAYGDLDNDGDLDIVINNVNQKAFIYQNKARQQSKNNYIGVSLKGKGTNTYAVGSKVKIYAGGQIMSRELIPSRGFQSSVDYKMIAGLGAVDKVDSVVIRWPDLTATTIAHPEINKVLVVDQKTVSAQMIAVKTVTQESPLLATSSQHFEKHKEDDYIDYYNERNIPRMLSQEGPKAAVGDVNGDGREDVYICGAAGQAGQLYLQTNDGGFVLKKQPAFEKYADMEDVAALFFDCDNDGDLDLFVGAGGNNAPGSSGKMQSHLYRNDGKGNFEVDVNAIPASRSNTAVVVASDFDNDGDLDLFVGGRSEPMNYGISPASYLYVNDGKGRFTDIAASKNPDIARIGMVTGAVWSDVNGDKQKDLIIVGEWMTPRIFSFANGKFNEIKTNLDSLYGWWQSISTADIDGDGDEDLILGNMGDNFYLRPNANKPVKLWMNDYDLNGALDKIITHTVNGKDMPVFLKREIVDQLPSLKKENLKHETFASKSIQELFPSNLVEKSLVKTFNYTPSIIAVNEGNGKFSIKRMPDEVQFSSVNAIACTDLNNDGYIDIIAGGNIFDFPPQLCRLDASFGSVLLNDGKGNFTAIGKDKSGLETRGQVRDIRLIKSGTGTGILVLQNNEYPLLYKSNGLKKDIVKKDTRTKD
ncbi:FG-GAP-like repeat-containing protein [Danxiaibacter flavus]|uniref:FG-GAP-like repeat-containing protein n=1 Tax=Danxiaibacter flavus TaxID=3049108 RepID=A0ABV3ZGT9_9BACT|nr:FG-GAP-like repeat-containing protein [Chitinophagaceae bacterium DXS]